MQMSSFCSLDHSDGFQKNIVIQPWWLLDGVHCLESGSRMNLDLLFVLLNTNRLGFPQIPMSSAALRRRSSA